MAASPVPFSTRLIGQTEKALNAILGSLLAGSGVTTQQWVALTVTLNKGNASAREAVDHVGAALGVSEAESSEVLEGLMDRGLVAAAGDGDAVTVTAVGREFHGRVQKRISAVTDRLWGDIPAADRQTAAAVLSTALERASTELVALRR